MNEIATPNSGVLEPDGLIETDGEILDKVRKDLSQEYTRFMGRLLKERLGFREGGSTSAFEQLSKMASTPPTQDRT